MPDHTGVGKGAVYPSGKVVIRNTFMDSVTLHTLSFNEVFDIVVSSSFSATEDEIFIIKDSASTP